MASNTLTDQYVVDRVAERAQGLFAYVPEPGFWLRYTADGWTLGLAVPKLQQLYLAVVEGLSRVNPDSRRDTNLLLTRLSFTAPDWAVRQLQQRPEMIVPFDHWNRHEVSEAVPPAEVFAAKRASQNPAGFWERPETISMIERTFSNRVDLIVKRTLLVPDSYARAHGANVPPYPPRLSSSLLIRRGESSICLSVWYEYLRSVYGDHVVRLPLPVWRHWPNSITPEMAWEMQGACYVFLDAPEKWERFPGIALTRLVTEQTYFWKGRDRAMHPLSVGACYFLCGAAVPDGVLNTFDDGLLNRTALLPGIRLEREQLR